MEKWKKRSIDLLTSLTFGTRGVSPSVVPYYPQKTEVNSFEERHFVRSVPEKHNISSKRVYNMLCELEGERRSNIHSLMILAGGEVIVECSREGFDVNSWHLSHSMSKTVTGMAIGMLCDDGLLSTDMRLVDLLPEFFYKDKRVASITVHHLLTMTSGSSFSEAGSVTETNWTDGFFASSMKFAPGTKFNYNSMNSYILAEIVTRVSGKGLTEFLDERLFSPLGIRNYFWERGPEGIEKGGWGLYLSAESWAKIGQMVLSGGEFEGRRILSAEWIEKSTVAHATSQDFHGDFNYGYQLWVGRNSEEILFNGMLGQNVWICPKNGIVAVILSGNNELFQDSPSLEIIRKYLGCEIGDELHKKDIKVLHQSETTFFDSRRWVHPIEKKHGLVYWLGVRTRTPFDDRWNDMLGSYEFGRNHIGILPLVVRAMQNNLSASMERLVFDRYEDSLYLIFREGGEEYRLEIGLYDYKENIIDFRGEKYIVKVIGEARVNTDGVGEYRIEFLFPELPNTRMLRIVKEDEDRIRVTFLEMPNNKIIENFIDKMVSSSSVIGFVIDLLERRFGDGFIEKKVNATFNPELVGANSVSPKLREIIAAENAKVAEETRTVRIIRALVDTFFKADEVDETPIATVAKVQDKPQKSFITDIIKRIRSARK